MFARQRGTALLIVLLAVVGLWGCSDSDDIVTPDFDPQDVQAGAQAAALVGPASELTQEIVMGLMQGALGAVAPMTSDTVGPTFQASVFLENGIEASCVLDDLGGLTCEFGGTVNVDGHDVLVTAGSMSVTLSDSQPSTGAAYDIQFGATASNATLGTSVWSTAGSVRVDETGEPVDYDFEMSHTVTPAGGSPMNVTVVVSPTQLELVATGPMGGTVRFTLNRLAMTGTVYVNGYQVATIVVEGSCTAIDFTSEKHQDVEICPTT